MQSKEGSGKIIKGYGGFYYVSDGGTLWECRLRGRLRKEAKGILIGDQVRFTIIDDQGHKGVVEELLPRRNQLLRPAVANVDQALIVLAPQDPLPDLWLLDRLLIMIQQAGLQPLLCWNKEDLSTGDDLVQLRNIYKNSGVIQLQTCALTGEGVMAVRSYLKNKTTVLAGPSGVGKSSLINQVEPGLTLKTGETSDKLGRGKHTTRHVEWIPLSFGGWVADTPGFSQIYLPEDLTKEGLKQLYLDFNLAKPCRFASCNHLKENDCGVKAAVQEGHIDQERFERYQAFMEELLAREKKY